MCSNQKLCLAWNPTEHRVGASRLELERLRLAPKNTCTNRLDFCALGPQSESRNYRQKSVVTALEILLNCQFLQGPSSNARAGCLSAQKQSLTSSLIRPLASSSSNRNFLSCSSQTMAWGQPLTSR